MVGQSEGHSAAVASAVAIVRDQLGNLKTRLRDRITLKDGQKAPPSGQHLQFFHKSKHSTKERWVNPCFAALLPGQGPIETVITAGTVNFLNLYNGALLLRLILTWFPNPPEVLLSPLATVCDPYLNLFRGLLPPLGQLDLSPILAFVLLNTVTNAAVALPAEMPADRKHVLAKTQEFRALCPSRGQIAWQKRQEAQRSQDDQ